MVVVVPEGWEEPTALLADELAAGKLVASVAGGPSRALSVAAGLAEVDDGASAVLVHDAARPFAPAEGSSTGCSTRWRARTVPCPASPSRTR